MEVKIVILGAFILWTSLDLLAAGILRGFELVSSKIGP